MFEHPDEVERAMLDLKIFCPLTEPNDEDDREEISPQIFPEHEMMSDRFRKTLYYGKLPCGGDRPSLPLTQLAVEQFTGVGLDALGEKLGRLDMGRASDISRQSCAGPNSLVLALLYLDRLRRRNPDYLNTVSSADLFLVSLLVASKFLHDDGEEDEVFNEDWATSGGIDKKELNKLEMNFLSALDWRIYVDNEEYKSQLGKIETDIAIREISSRGYSSYSDLTVLTNQLHLRSVWDLLLQSTLQVTAVCMTAYTASLLTLLSTTAILSRTSVGPTAVSHSLSTLLSSVDDDSNSVPVLDDNLSLRPIVNHVDLVAASLLVATLTSGSVTNKNDSSEIIQDYSAQSPYRRLTRNRIGRNLNEIPQNSIGINLEEIPKTNYHFSTLADRVVFNETEFIWHSDEKDQISDWDREVPPNNDWLKHQAEFIHHGTGLGGLLVTGMARFWSDLIWTPPDTEHQALNPFLEYLGRCPVLNGNIQANWLDHNMIKI